MKGMELSKKYFEEYGLPMLQNEFPEDMKQVAVGLVGEGSECFGYDDEISKDHDFGPGFCIWIPIETYSAVGEKMQEAYDRLPAVFMGHERISTSMSDKRVGVIPLETFYSRYTNCGPFPTDNVNWMNIPESYLATVTNGEIFMDNYGVFTKAREHILKFYPEDVLRKKLANRVAVMAQSGQYNYVRSSKRGDYGSAYLACAEFVKAALSCIFLLNRQYAPFYKWIFRAARQLPKMKETVSSLERLIKIADDANTVHIKQDMIENICSDVADELRATGFTKEKDNFLQLHIKELMAGIEDVRIRSMHVMEDC